MDKLVTDSFFNRKRRERDILGELVPPERVEVKRRGVVLAARGGPASAKALRRMERVWREDRVRRRPPADAARGAAEVAQADGDEAGHAARDDDSSRAAAEMLLHRLAPERDVGARH